MNIKRGITAGIILWVLIFFEVSILMFGFKLTAGITYYTIHYIVLAVLTYIAVLFYFRGKKIKRNAREGLKLGIVMLITGIILDAIITLPLWIIPQGGSYSSFFSDLYLIAGFAEIVIIAIILGSVKKSS